MRICPARHSDLAALTDIYNWYVEHTHVTFEKAPATRVERAARLHERSRAPHRVLVAELDGEVAVALPDELPSHLLFRQRAPDLQANPERSLRASALIAPRRVPGAFLLPASAYHTRGRRLVALRGHPRRRNAITRLALQRPNPRRVRANGYSKLRRSRREDRRRAVGHCRLR